MNITKLFAHTHTQPSGEHNDSLNLKQVDQIPSIVITNEDQTKQ